MYVTHDGIRYDYIYYDDGRIESILSDVIKLENCVRQKEQGNWYNVLNLPVSFDIETSNTYLDGKKIAFMYIWMLNINGVNIIGRNWGQFTELMYRIINHLSKINNGRMIIWIHNLAFEFQFIQKMFDWNRVFSLDSRTPVSAETAYGIIFRCSYKLSGKSLADTVKEVGARKLTGDLDYSLVRHSDTKLSDAELAYCIADVNELSKWIQYKITVDGDITKIPLTKTGYVRRLCRERCLFKTSATGKRVANKKYRDKLFPMSESEYRLIKAAYAGGFTHASLYNVGKLMDDVSSYDISSSYPTVMLLEQYPCSSGEEVTITSSDDLNKLMETHCCLIPCRFKNLQLRGNAWEIPLSFSKTLKSVSEQCYNGRVLSSKEVIVVLTDVDYKLISEYYTWDSVEYGVVTKYRKDYLPRELLEVVLELYDKKTVLKNVVEKRLEYTKSKELLNSVYGMVVTDPCRDVYNFVDWQWSAEKENLADVIDRYNADKQRFINYQWGAWITAYARRNLFMIISALGADYIYADTDSVKFTNASAYEEIFKSYEKLLMYKIKMSSERNLLDIKKFNPDGKNLIGAWAYEGTYKKFKTLGAKRYIYGDDTDIHMTTAGVNGVRAVEYMRKKFPDVYEAFDDGLKIPEEYTGKLTHTYIDEEISGSIVDYNGVSGEYQEYSYIHLSGADFSMSVHDNYLDLRLNQVFNVESVAV